MEHRLLAALIALSFAAPALAAQAKRPAARKVAPPARTARPQAQLKRSCFGAIGAQCWGAPTVSASAVPGGVRMAVAVGSILHDNCCLTHPNGMWCHGPRTLIDNHNACEAEWHKAEVDTLERRVWWHVFSGKPDDLGVVPARRAVLLNGQVWRGTETVSSRKLSAPRGTRLDPGDEAFCQSGRAKQGGLGPVKWIVCQ